MNITPPADPPYPPAAPADWTIEMDSAWDSRGIVVYVADVKRAGQFMCRIALCGPNDETSARKSLATKARTWIDNFLNRERQGLDIDALHGLATATKWTRFIHGWWAAAMGWLRH